MAEKTDTALPMEYKDKPSSPDSPDFAQGQVLDREGHVIDGSDKYKKLSWQRLTICLIVEAIALGSLGIPGAFADLGMAAGIILTIGLGLCAIYAGDIVGQVYCKYPHVKDFGDALGLIGGRPGYWIGSAMFCLYLTLVLGSHALTGTIAWVDIVQKPGVCALVWSIISAIILFALALPPSFTEFAILGYVDFASIILAIGITIISTGIRAHQSDGGLSGVNWTALPPPDVTFAKAFNSVSNIIFAYSFTVCQFSFMAELHTPRDYRKAIWALGIAEIFIYTITGSLIYAFVGRDVKSPALLSAGNTVSRIAFGVALPVIFISGSISGTVVARHIIDRAYKNSAVRYVNTVKGWTVWASILAVLTLIGWVVAEAIPFFSDLLGIISALFVSGFQYWMPALFWFFLLRDREAKWNRDWKAVGAMVLSALLFVIGIGTLGMGTYASAKDIADSYKSGNVRGAFACDSSSYT